MNSLLLTFSPSIVYKRGKSRQLMRFRPGHCHFFLVSFNLFLIILGLRVSLLRLRWQLFCFSKKKNLYTKWLKKQQGNEDGFLQSFIGNCRVECMLIKVHMWKVCNDFFLLDNLWPINLFWWNTSLLCCAWVKLSYVSWSETVKGKHGAREREYGEVDYNSLYTINLE